MSNKIWEFECPWDKTQLLNEFDASSASTFSEYNTEWKKTWELGSYGHLSKPPELTKYQENPPAFTAVGKQD